MNLLLALVLFSSTFANGGALPSRAAAIPCGGSGISPELHWNAAPPGTRSFALILHDPDAPAPGGFYHWVLYDLPSSTTELPANSKVAGHRAGRNSFGTIGYGGPCPPPGPAHHYHFTLYALNVQIDSPQPLTAEQLQARMRSHILAHAELVGLFQR